LFGAADFTAIFDVGPYAKNGLPLEANHTVIIDKMLHAAHHARCGNALSCRDLQGGR
jgi:hypothetical protein